MSAPTPRPRSRGHFLFAADFSLAADAGSAWRQDGGGCENDRSSRAWRFEEATREHGSVEDDASQGPEASPHPQTPTPICERRVSTGDGGNKGSAVFFSPLDFVISVSGALPGPSCSHPNRRGCVFTLVPPSPCPASRPARLAALRPLGVAEGGCR
jgi:hypothetical protein